MRRLMYIKIDGIRGSSCAPRHFGEIEVTSFSWGERSPSVSGSGGGPGKISMNDLTFQKRSDQSSPVFRVASANGQHFKSAVLTLEKVSEQGSLLHVVIVKMTDVLVDFATTYGDQDTIGITFLEKEFEERKSDK